MCRFGIGTDFPRKPNFRADGRGRDLERVYSETFPVFISCLLNDHFAGIGLCLMNGYLQRIFFLRFPSEIVVSLRSHISAQRSSSNGKILFSQNIRAPVVNVSTFMTNLKFKKNWTQPSYMNSKGKKKDNCVVRSEYFFTNEH